ncbi:MAG: hypothetical protein MUD12_13430 [Spirochaetes bacterium]|jgi:hypothetical protein|nr:hypothetical protein [Spirochaetota bacterium]
MKHLTIAAASAALLLLISCASTPVPETVAGNEISGSEIKSLIGSIDAINRTAPSSFTASFFVEGTMGGKKFKTMGDAEFDRKTGRMYVSFIDFIFRTPITSMYKNMDKINLFSHVEKILFDDSYKNFRIGRYTEVNIDFKSVYALATGSIPLIEGYRIRKGVRDAKTGLDYIILENGDFFQTIGLKDGVPNRIMLVSKDTKEKFEFYMEKPDKRGGAMYFQKIILVSKSPEARFDISFNGVRMNVPVNVKTVDGLKLPKDVRKIKM